MKTTRALFFIICAFWLSCNQSEFTFPEDKLPKHIKPLVPFGQRSEFSLDGKTIYFVDKAGGEVFKVNIQTGNYEQLSEPEWRPEGHGYYRVLCLANGDFLYICGDGRRTTYMQIQDKELKTLPVTLDEPINEGPAISRRTMKIAWTQKQEKIWVGEIVYNEGIPSISGKKLVVDNSNVIVDGIKYHDIIEPQNFRPPDDLELIWSQYGKTEKGLFSSETMGIDLLTGKMVNYSKAPNTYDEPEGILPNGAFTLIECDAHNPLGTSKIDIYALKLDAKKVEKKRLTFFADEEGFRSSNPVVSDDGKYIAFQASVSESDAGVGCGIYLFDVEKSGLLDITEITAFDTLSYYNAAVQASKNNEFEKAYRNFKKVIALKYGGPKVVLFAANQCKAIGDTTKALSIFKLGIKAYPNDNRTFFVELINYYLRTKKTDDAIKYLTMALERDKNNSKYLFALATLFDHSKKDPQKAIEYYEKSIELDPNFLGAQYNLGAVYYNMAAKLIDTSSFPEAPSQNAKDLEAKDYYRKALPYFEKAHEINPTEKNILQTLKTIYSKLEMEEQLEGLQ